jgi:transposase
MKSIPHIPSVRECQLMVERTVLARAGYCPVCAGKVKRTPTYLWCKVCRKKIRPKAATWLRGSKLSYQQIYVLLLSWQKNLSPGAVKALTGLSYTCINRWHGKFRTHLPREVSVLEGVVEIDESYFGRRKYNNQRLVIGAVRRTEKKLRLKIIPTDAKAEMEDFVYATTSTEAVVHTDAHPGYYDLNLWGFGHTIWNHSKGHFSGTNQIEATWSVIKRRIRRMYGQIRTNKLETYLPEWEARVNYPHLFQDPKTYLQETLFRIS